MTTNVRCLVHMLCIYKYELEVLNQGDLDGVNTLISEIRSLIKERDYPVIGWLISHQIMPG